MSLITVSTVLTGDESALPLPEAGAGDGVVSPGLAWQAAISSRLAPAMLRTGLTSAKSGVM
jgi:hypothetical protein